MKRSMGLVAGAALLAGLASGPAAATTFSILDYNVHGWPAAVIGDRSAQMTQIAQKLEDFHTAGGDYDGQNAIVLLQEVFDQGYYNALTNPALETYPYVSPKDSGGPSGIGSGLTRLSDFYQFPDYIRWHWPDCFGTGGANGSDCDTDKGYSYARYEIDPGIVIGVYELHADEGSDPGSVTARRSNINLLIAAINTMSPAGNAIIVTGDTNSHYTSVAPAGDNIDSLLTSTGVKDVWVELVKGGVVPAPGPDIDSGCLINPSGADCELADKIFYRSGDYVTLTPTSYAALGAFFSDSGGNGLSEHYPVTALFECSRVFPTSSTTPSSTTTTTTTTTLPPRSCGDPVVHPVAASPKDVNDGGDAAAVSASDALRILKAAVGQPVVCELCVCDVDNNGSLTTSDALRVLKLVVGQAVTLNCPPC